MSYHNTTYHHQWQLHESFPHLHPTPPLLKRSNYGILLSGNDGELALLPVFTNMFTREHNLRSWRLCGAGPLMRSVLQT
jgi:hypothetical protein